MGKVKSFDQFQESRDSESKGSSEISEESGCSDGCSGQIGDAFGVMMAEMKERHHDDSDMSAQKYYEACESLLKSHSGAMKAECEKMMGESSEDSEDSEDKKEKD
jgi:hypothetical protein